jgi:hypothetical protein
VFYSIFPAGKYDEKTKENFLFRNEVYYIKIFFVFLQGFPNYQRKGMGVRKGETVGFPLTKGGS